MVRTPPFWYDFLIFLQTVHTRGGAVAPTGLAEAVRRQPLNNSFYKAATLTDDGDIVPYVFLRCIPRTPCFSGVTILRSIVALGYFFLLLRLVYCIAVLLQPRWQVQV